MNFLLLKFVFRNVSSYILLHLYMLGNICAQHEGLWRLLLPDEATCRKFQKCVLCTKFDKYVFKYIVISVYQYSTTIPHCEKKILWVFTQWIWLIFKIKSNQHQIPVKKHYLKLQRKLWFRWINTKKSVFDQMDIDKTYTYIFQ